MSRGAREIVPNQMSFDMSNGVCLLNNAKSDAISMVKADASGGYTVYLPFMPMYSYHDSGRLLHDFHYGTDRFSPESFKLTYDLRPSGNPFNITAALRKIVPDGSMSVEKMKYVFNTIHVNPKEGNVKRTIGDGEVDQKFKTLVVDLEKMSFYLTVTVYPIETPSYRDYFNPGSLITFDYCVRRLE
jgi:hypothetical protein